MEHYYPGSADSDDFYYEDSPIIDSDLPHGLEDMIDDETSSSDIQGDTNVESPNEDEQQLQAQQLEAQQLEPNNSNTSTIDEDEAYWGDDEN